jgi:hypothetical protein
MFSVTEENSATAPGPGGAVVVIVVDLYAHVPADAAAVAADVVRVADVARVL